MSRLGEFTAPVGLDRIDLLHVWFLVRHGQDGAVELFLAAEQALDELAQARGAFLSCSPGYETFRPLDPGVPLSIRVLAAPHLGDADHPVLAVHAWAQHAVRNTVPAAARPLLEEPPC